MEKMTVKPHPQHRAGWKGSADGIMVVVVVVNDCGT
jgi:hypothetical protein